MSVWAAIPLIGSDTTRDRRLNFVAVLQKWGSRKRNLELVGLTIVSSISFGSSHSLSPELYSLTSTSRSMLGVSKLRDTGATGSLRTNGYE
jgi:hypothetical protein